MTAPPPPGFDPSRECQCRLCEYDRDFAARIAFVPEDHRAFFEELKERWEEVDFDAGYFRACVGGEEYTVEFCERYDAQRARVTRRFRDSGLGPAGDDPARGDIPQCRECGQPSPNGDPCEDCAEVERILSMTDEEVIASSSPEEVAWSEGIVEGIKIGIMLAGARARDSDGSRNGRDREDGLDGEAATARAGTASPNPSEEQPQ